MLFDDEGHILLLEHVFRADRGWGVPGGFINKGEQPEQALRRELREEVDIEIDDVKTPVRQKSGQAETGGDLLSCAGDRRTETIKL
jgi:ADP-ribose pyrophosphatase YjhB (NUDIX family)